jgi:hypothetical protein
MRLRFWVSGKWRLELWRVEGKKKALVGVGNGRRMGDGSDRMRWRLGLQTEEGGGWMNGGSNRALRTPVDD